MIVVIVIVEETAFQTVTRLWSTTYKIFAIKQSTAFQSITHLWSTIYKILKVRQSTNWCRKKCRIWKTFKEVLNCDSTKIHQCWVVEVWVICITKKSLFGSKNNILSVELDMQSKLCMTFVHRSYIPTTGIWKFGMKNNLEYQNYIIHEF